MAEYGVSAAGAFLSDGRGQRAPPALSEIPSPTYRIPPPVVNLLGTRFDRTREFVERYREDGIIWFLEACDLNFFAIRRAMWQMEEAGWLEHVKGFLVGRPMNGAPMMNLDAWGAFLEVAGRKTFHSNSPACLSYLSYAYASTLSYILFTMRFLFLVQLQKYWYLFHA